VADKRKLLVVDDMQVNRLILADLFDEQYEVLEAENGREALDIIEQNNNDIAIVLLDLLMPVMDGFGVLEEMNRTGIIQTIPVIMITSESDEEKIQIGYKLGVADLINKQFNPDIVYTRVNNVIALYSHKRDLVEKLEEQRIKLDLQTKRIRQANQFLIDALSTTVEFRNMESGTHIKRIRTFVHILLEAFHDHFPIPSEQIEIISNSSALHDIGKIAISDSILLKAGPLTREERAIMETHTMRGCEMLTMIDYIQDREYFNYSYEICRYHHERWDGKGYPDKLIGDEIPIWAQVASLADVYDALTSKRVYKGAYTHEQAIEMITGGECGAFNPLMLECFMEVKDTLHEQLHNNMQ